MTETVELTLVRIGDKVHLDGVAPPTIHITQGLLNDHDPRFMRVDGEDIVFTLANGRWQYRIVGVVNVGVVSARKVSGACCGMHNTNCEPPSELCCQDCTEAAHDTWPVRHGDGSACVMDAEGRAEGEQTKDLRGAVGLAVGDSKPTQDHNRES